MNTPILRSRHLSAFATSLILLALALLWSPSQARAGHDHDHLFVTIDRDLGYDADSEIHKVQVSTSRASYILSFHGSLRTIASHVGGKARISVSDSGRWTHFAIVDHGGAVGIHTVKRLE